MLFLTEATEARGTGEVSEKRDATWNMEIGYGISGEFKVILFFLLVLIYIYISRIQLNFLNSFSTGKPALFCRTGHDVWTSTSPILEGFGGETCCEDMPRSMASLPLVVLEATVTRQWMFFFSKVLNRKAGRFFFLADLTLPKTNIAPENQRLEDVFPIEIVPF